MPNYPQTLPVKPQPAEELAAENVKSAAATVGEAAFAIASVS